MHRDRNGQEMDNKKIGKNKIACTHFETLFSRKKIAFHRKKQRK